MPVITPEQAGGQAVCDFLDTIAFSEGTSTGLDNGYGVIVSGVDGAHSFTNYSAHPFADGREAIEVVAPGERFPRGLWSSASGRYQFTLPTWKYLAHKNSLGDFSPLSQDIACVEYLDDHGVITMLLAGMLKKAISTCGQSWGWASMPGSEAGQGGKTMEALVEHYGSGVANG